MARGSTSSQGRAAQSELSERLRREAQALRNKNEEDKKEAEQNQKDYDDALETAYMRAEEETAEDFRGKKMSVSEAEQAKREEDAKKAEEAAKAEEEREAEEERVKSGVMEKFSKDIKSSPLTYDDWTNAYWYMSIETKGDETLKSLIPDLYNYDRNYLSDDYINFAVSAAPENIRNAVKESLECFRANGRNDRYPGEAAEKLYAGMNTAYAVAAVGKDIFIDTERPERSTGVDKLTLSKHEAGMAALKQTDRYIGRVLLNAKEHLVDKDGKEIA